MKTPQNKGIDERDIKCSCDNDNCCESGISIEEETERNYYLKFYYTEYIDTGCGNGIYSQKCKSMKLSQETTEELIKKLQELTF